MFELRPVAIAIATFLYSAMSLNSALADDTEIYVPRDLPADQQVRPNILFILDSSGSMDSPVRNSGNRTRTQVMQGVVNKLIDDLKTKEDVNIGLMRFRGTNNNQGGRILSPVQRLTAANADSMKTTVNNIPASDWTPLSETYYEAYLYMTGQAPFWGANSSVASSMAGGKYISPISHACQKSHIIYVTDGEPTYDVDSNDAIRTLASSNKTYKPSTCNNNDNTRGGECLPHLAEYMANQDLFPNPTSFLDPTKRKQTVTSHFVGFAIDLPLLKNAAQAGEGRYYTSDNVSGLTEALKSIIVDITAENTSFAAPSVAVSAFNNLGFRNDLYYALFRPAEGANWPGNVKRYKLGRDNQGNPLIVDQNGNAAIDDSTGFFSNSASSFWSASADGSDVAKGGVAGRLLDPDNRKLFTWTGTDRTATASSGVTGSVNLNTANYRLLDTNTLVTNSLLGAGNNTQRGQFINWARGKNTDGTNRLAIADVLHNEPKLIAYVTDEDLDRVTNSPLTSPEQLYMFFGSNEGYIHAIDPKTGDEKFAFIPKELLANPGAYLTNAKGSSSKKYGIDGQINLWTSYRTPTAVNGDIAAKRRVLDKAILYAGMRRGGSNYYALDVSNIDSPAFKWMIKGAYADTSTPGFERLGLTFSTPLLADVNINGTKTKVLFFTGGYDRNHDTVGTNIPRNDSIGNALFMVDAETGRLLWRAGGSSDTGANLQIANMTNSMPADPAIIDNNGDGLADIIFTADLRGQVFRFDINNGNTGIASDFASGGRIAALAGDTAAENRRFFGSPDVALIRERGGKTYFTISIGTGFRESPLNMDTNDRFYVLRDSNVFSKPTSYVTLTESDLTNVTGFNLSATDTAKIQADIKKHEDSMLALNNAVNGARQSFVNYRAGINHTAKQNAASQAISDADARQKQIDETLFEDPYILVNNNDLHEQSELQSSLEKAQAALAQLQKLFSDTADLADAADAFALGIQRQDAESNNTAAANAFASAQASADADTAAAATAESAAVSAETAAATATQNEAAAQLAKNQADQVAADALIDRDAKITAFNNANTAFNSASQNNNTAIANQQDASDYKNNTTAPALTIATAEHTAATLAFEAIFAANNFDTNHPNVIQALADENSAFIALQKAQQDDSDAQLAVDGANNILASTSATLTTATNNLTSADTNLNAANILLTTKIADAGTAATNFTNASGVATTANQNAVNLRAAATTAQTTAQSSSAVAATKLTEKAAAQAALTAATQAYDEAVLNDNNLAALQTQRDQLALQYARLTELQRSLDEAFAPVKAQEAKLIAARSDPSLIDGGLPAMETELEALRNAYNARTDLITRANLNLGSPSKLDALLNGVKTALDTNGVTADIIAALTPALASLQSDSDITALPSGFHIGYATLLAREEVLKASALKAKALNSQTIVNQIVTLQTEQAALLVTGAALQAEADALAARPYTVSSNLLSAAQLSALQAQTAPDTPTLFDAYQFLIDQALANAADPLKGLPFLRSEIEKEYAKLTPGNNYTPNTALLAASQGFYLRLPKGEKVLSSSISFRGSVLFSTFSPRGQAVSTCGSDVGRGRTYAISLTDASALFTETASDGSKTPIRSFDLKRSGIPPTPSVILGDGYKPTFLTGTEVIKKECVDGAPGCTAGDAVKATYWREN
ncbi:MAG: pilus assembly protein PilY [Pseudomonas sp.]|nr:pilus assembly protein PilY [Pseudomonas sp.]